MTAAAITRDQGLRRALLGPELNLCPRMSPDGRVIAFLRTCENGQELWLRHSDGCERFVVGLPGELACDLRWTADGSALALRRAQRGRESWQLSVLSLANLELIDLPSPGPVTEYWLSSSDPDALAMCCRSAGTRRLEVFLADLARPGAEPTAMSPNPGFYQWLVDGDLHQRGGIRLRPDGSAQVMLGDRPDTARKVLTVGRNAVADLSVQQFSRDGERLFLLTSQDSASRRLVAIEARTGVIATVFEHPRLDIAGYPITRDGVWFNPDSGLPDIYSVIDQRLIYHTQDRRLRRALDHLRATDNFSPLIIERGAGDRVWLVVYVRDDGPIDYRFFDPETGRSRSQLVNRPDLTGRRLPKLGDFFFTASDGRRLAGYFMRPLGSAGPLPTVMLVHGGPAGRDYWRFNSDAQYLALLGYQTLHINYRGSCGFGARFRLAGHGEWGGRMQQDLYDAVDQGIAEGIVDPRRVAFMGSSYGGYAALLSGCTRQDLARCVIAISAPCDLASLALRPSAYWSPLAVQVRRQVTARQAGPDLDEAELMRRSPSHLLRRSSAPVMLVHGARDPRVAVSEIDGFAARAQELGIPLRYLRFDDEGHQVKSAANRITMFAAIEEFLEEHFAVSSPSDQEAVQP
jgi:dipeptidyl aminopeptidase/acylaminoacyl peptidase